MSKGKGHAAGDRGRVFAGRAQALEEELGRFERFCAEVAGIPLDSQRSFERGARMLQDLAEVEQRLNARAEELAATLGELRAAQSASAAAVVDWANRLKAGRDRFAALQERFVALSADAATLDAAIRGQLAGALQNRTKPDAAAVAHVVVQLREFAGQWRELEQEARQEGFRDLTRDTEARRQQLEALAAKLEAVQPQTPDN